jgi:GH24 family phage-related lysozyme (muramidase)
MGEWDNGSDDCYAPSDYKSTDDFWQDGVGSTLDDYFGITESMAEYEAEQEAEKEDVHEYVKGQAMNIGEEV